MLAKNKYYFVPVVNPDGVALIEQNHKENPSPTKIMDKRKNMNPAGVEKCDAQSLGVDLNRNYKTDWQLNQKYKSQSDPCFEF
jgi:g-D-glutamyl-meso-diaminopimelate peptidase